MGHPDTASKSMTFNQTHCLSGIHLRTSPQKITKLCGNSAVGPKIKVRFWKSLSSVKVLFSLLAHTVIYYTNV